MIHDLRGQGLSISAIARKVGSDRKIVRKYLDMGLEAPCYGPRPLQGSLLDPYRDYLTERVRAFPDLSGRRLLREIKSMGYEGSYSTLKSFLRELRPPLHAPFSQRFETPPGEQAQVDFAEFKVQFTDEPGVIRKVWLFSLVLGHSRWLWGRFESSQNLQTVVRCNISAFDAMGGAPEEILYDRIKTAVIGEDDAGIVTYNTSLVALLNHYGARPKPANRTGLRRKERLKGHSATSARTSFWRVLSATSTI